MLVCTEARLVEPLIDEFGPAIYLKRTGDWAHYQNLLEGLEYAPLFRKLEKAGYGWLKQALQKILTERAKEAKVEQATKDQWEPIAVDRSNESVKKVISALDETIEAVRADNGYSASQPEERRLVLDALRAAGLRLKEDTQISLTYLNEIALKPLVVVVKRFGKAAVGTLCNRCSQSNHRLAEGERDRHSQGDREVDEAKAPPKQSL